MGGGSWNTTLYRSSFSASYVDKSTEEIFNQRTIHEDLNPLMMKNGVRESCDSKEHPNSIPIIIALDVTGSMGAIPNRLVREDLPKLMDQLIENGCTNPQILFMGIGDHECDQCPIQISQFESSTESINQCLTKIYLEGGGGGNHGESYALAWLLAGDHTLIDSFNKRQAKGFLFTIGDEPVLPKISGTTLHKLLGYEANSKDISMQECLEKAKKTYNVYHIHIDHNQYTKNVKSQLGELLGSNLIIVDNIYEIVKHIAKIITYRDILNSSNQEKSSESNIIQDPYFDFL